MRRLAASVLAMEAIVVALALPVAVTMADVGPAVAGTGAGVLIAAVVVVAGLLRYRAAYVAGSFLQVVLIASGVVVSAMYFLGAVFAILWGTALWLGARTYEPDAR